LVLYGEPAAERSASRALLAELAGRLLELTHQATEGFAAVSVHRTQAVDDHARPGQKQFELRAASQIVELLAPAVQQEEPVQVPAVRRQQPGIEVLDPAVLLQLAEVLDGLVEDV
jgi:hypothetical protein